MSTLVESFELVFVPFLGDLFSISNEVILPDEDPTGFRPLSRGLFFNTLEMGIIKPIWNSSFRPLSRGLFFNTRTERPSIHHSAESFRPLSRGLFFN